MRSRRERARTDCGRGRSHGHGASLGQALELGGRYGRSGRREAGRGDVRPRILIADDQPDVLEALRFLLKGEGYRPSRVDSPPAAIDAVESREFDAVLMDLNYTRDTTSGQEGLDLLNRIQALDTTLPVIVMTAWGSVELAVEAMRRGARDFIQKPWDNARLSAILRTQIELGRALRKGQRLEAENRALRAERLPAADRRSRRRCGRCSS